MRLMGVLIAAAMCMIASPLRLAAQTPLGSDFIYQGQLKASGMPAITTADFTYSLFNDVVAGAQVGATLSKNNVAVVNGLFMLPLDFGATAFNGESRWIEVALRSPAGSGGFTVLAPRQPLTAAPYALQTRGIFVNPTGSIGIGTTTPASTLHVLGEGPGIQVQDDDDPASFLRLEHNQPGQMSLNNVAGTDISLLDLNPMPLNSAQNAHVRIFRQTNTSGLKSVIFHSGNNTAAQSAVIGVGGSSSAFQLDGGNFGIGTPTPSTKLDVRGEIVFGDNAELRPVAAKQVELRIVQGRVSDVGQTNSPGFNANRFSEGHYDVTFNPPFPTSPVVTATVIESSVSPAFMTVVPSTGGHCSLRVNQTNGTYADRDFFFIAIGPR